MFTVVSRLETNPSKKVIGEFSALEIDQGHFDLRLFDIIPTFTFKKMTGHVPHSIIEAVVPCGDSFVKELIPIFKDGDLSGLFISTTGNLIYKECLSQQQRDWIEFQKEADKVF